MNNNSPAYEREKGEPKIEIEQNVGSGSSSNTTTTMTLQKAIDMGEYNPEYLATFAEWHTLSRQIQWQMIKQAVANRERQLIQQWAEVNNVIDFRLKPELKEALDNIWKQRERVKEDKEKLMVEYSREV